MRTHPLRPYLALVLACLLAILLFLLGTAGAAAHFWGRYLLPLLVVFLWGRRRDIYIVTVLASVLVVVEYWTGGAVPLGDPLVNYLLYILVLWGAAWLLARRHAELQASEQRFAKVFHANPGGILITRQGDGLILEINEACLALGGYTREQLIGRNAVELGILPAASRARMTAAFQAHGFLRDLDVQLINARGEPADVLYSAEEIEFNGEPCYLGLIVDITERNRLAAQTDHLAALVDAAGDAITSCDLDGKILTMNPSAEVLYRISADTTIGQNIATIAPPDLHGFMREMMGSVSGGRVAWDDVPWRRPDGSTRILSLSLAPVRNHAGQVTALSSIARDVTERKAAERERIFLSALVASSPESVVGRTVDGTILSWNVGAEQLFGYTAAEAIGQNVTILAAPGSSASMAAEIAAIAHGTALQGIETQRMAKDGRVFDCQVSVFPVRDAAGEILGVASFAHDISERKRLEATATRLAAIVESSPDAIASTDLQGRVVTWNHSAEQMYECSAAEAIGRPINEILPPGPNTDEAAVVAKVRSGATMPVADRSWTKADGTRIDLSIILSPVKDKHGAVTGMASIARDVSGRKRLEAEVRQSEARFRAMFAEHAAVMLLVDPATGAIADSNQAAAGFYGYTNAELQGLHIWDINALPRAEVEAQMQHACDHDLNAFIFPHRLADGTMREVEVHSSPINAGGSKVLFSIVHDVTARRQAEEALAASEEKYRMLFDHAGDGIFLLDPEGRFLEANDRFCQMLARSRAEIIGAHIAEMTEGITPELFAPLAAELALTGAVTFEHRLRRMDGDLPSVEVTITLLSGGRRMAIMRDVTERKAAERDRLFLSALVASSPEAVIGRTVDGTILSWNHGAEQLFGYMAEEAIGQNLTMLAAPDSLAHLQDVMAQVAQGHDVEGVETQRMAKDGRVFDCEISSFPVRDGSGAIVGVASFTHDISERKAAEQALAASEHKYRDLYDHSPDMYFVGVPAQGLILDCNQTLARTLGYTAKELIGGPSSVLYAPATYAQLQADRDELMATGEYQNDAVQLRRRDGTLLDVIMAVTLEQDPAGGPARARVTLHDITERMAAERAVARLAAIVQSSNDAMISADPDGTLRTMNRAAEQLFGIPATEAIGHHISLINPDLSESDRAAMFARLRAGEAFTLPDFTWTALDGRRVDLSVTALPITDNSGQAFGVASIARDITGRKRLEAVLRRSEERFRAMFAEHAAVMLLLDPATGAIIDANQAAAEFYGYTGAELRALNIWELNTLPRAEVQANLQPARDQKANEFFFSHRLADGTIRDVEVHVSAIAAGSGTLLFAVIHDVTARREAEAALRRSEQKWRSVFEFLPVGLSVVDGKDKVADSNPALADILQMTPEGIREGRYARRRYFHADMRPMADDEFPSQRALRERQVVRDEVIGIEKEDGELIWVSVSATPESIEGLALTVTVDLTALKRAEAERLALAERWKMAAQVSSIGVWDWHAGSDEVMWDEWMYQIHGLAPGTAVSFALWRTLIHPDDRAAVEANSRKSGVERTWTPVEYRVLLPDGSLRHLLATGGGFYDAAGTPVRQLGISMDITERKRAEEQLRASEEKFSHFFAANPAAVCVTRRADDVYVEVNAAYLELTGYTLDELIGCPYTALGVFSSSYSADLRAVMLAEGRVHNVETQITGKWGTPIDILVSVETIDVDGAPCSLTMMVDITERKRMEHVLAESERKYRDLYDNSPDMYLSGYPTDHLIHECNQTLARTLGYTREELLGQPNSIVLTPASYSHMLAELPKYAGAGEYANIEVQLQCKDGTVIDALASGLIEPPTAGRPAYSRVSLHDITKRKLAEVALAVSEAQLRAVIENTADSIWSVDRDYCFLVGNTEFLRSAQQQSGRSLAVGECVFDDSPPGERAFWQPLYGRALAGESVMFEIPAGFQPTGGIIACYLNPIYALDGAITGVTGRAADITALKQAEAQLREAYQHLQLAADAAAIGIWNWNFADGRLEWDDRMCELYAVTAAERATGIFYDLWRARVHPDDLALAEPAQGDPNRAGSTFAQTYRILLPDGAVRYIQASSVVEYDQDGKPRRMVGTNRDITDQKQYERLLQDTNAVLEEHVAARTAELRTAFAELQRANQLKDEFMAMISHELRTPLTGVLSMSEMLEDQVAGPLNDRQLNYVKNIIHSGERLLAVINGILGYTHLLSGKVQLHADPCELAHLLNICAVSQQHKAAAKSQAIAVQVTPPDLTITADANALAEVLKRLLDNAVKFTPDGGQVGFEAHPGTAPLTVDLVVWDTGIGIAADQLDNVFHAFTQADARLSRSHEGIGISLAYVDEMVRLMGGTIRLESTPGEGSRFTITLPTRPPE